MTDAIVSRRACLLAAAAAGAAAAPLRAQAQDDPKLATEAETVETPAAPPALLTLSGKLTQGGAVIGRLAAPGPVSIDGVAVPVGEDGAFIAGFDRDAPGAARLEIGEGDALIGVDLPVTARSYASGESIVTTRSLLSGGGDFSPLDDLIFDEDEIDALVAEELASLGPSTRSLSAGPSADAEVLSERISREARLKRAALESRAAASGFLEPFLWPLDGELRITSAWGTLRNYSNGAQKPHYGVDLAAPIGTPIRVPAAGVVTLAEPDMYYEGGCVFLDHGLGLTSIYLHMNEVHVSAGDTVARGAPLGAVGTKGRSTGPHLCWRLYWRDRKLDPTLLIA